MGLLLLTVVVVGAVMLAMALGVILSNRCLRGSCGGPEVPGPDGESLACDACPRRRAAGHGSDIGVRGTRL
jgi:hypothetical protein